MALLTAGFFHTTFFQDSFWQEDFWQDYGAAAAAGKSFTKRYSWMILNYEAL